MLQRIDKTYRSPAENLALEEALLDYCEQSDHPGFLRFWESPVHFVVLGYSKPLTREANEPFCQGRHIPILRRCTGGGTVLQGPGCFNYTLVLPIESHPELESITSTNCYIMQQQRLVVEKLLGEPVQVQGHTDLTIRNLKFSGNSQRRKRRALLFHGCFLTGMDLTLVEQALQLPEQQPEYRQHRTHRDFLTNLSINISELANALATRWNATSSSIPLEAQHLCSQLSEATYQQDHWNRRF